MKQEIIGVKIRLGNEERTLSLDLNALINYATYTGGDVFDAINKLKKAPSIADKMTGVRTIVWAMLTSSMEWDLSRAAADIMMVGNWLHPGNLSRILQAINDCQGLYEQENEFEGQLAPYVPSPAAVVEAMQALANIRDNDYILDLGAGDGRLLFAAADAVKAGGFKGCKIVGYELEMNRATTIKTAIREKKLGSLVMLRQVDIMEAAENGDAAEASIVFMYLLQSTTNRIYQELGFQPGTRIVTHDFTIDGLTPENSLTVVDDSGTNHIVSSYLVPKPAPAVQPAAPTLNAAADAAPVPETVNA